MKTCMFPGQGSQAAGMGAGLFERFPELVEQADMILGYSIKELCLEDPRQELNNTEFTQPALYVVNALSYYSKTQSTGSKPDFLAGHSLGEFNALLAAEAFDFATGLRLVRKRGELMSRIANGAMAAILNVSKDELESILKDNGLHNVDLANYNTPSQIVISGLTEEICKAEPLFQQGKMRYYRLNTSGAFHSRFMESVKQEFSEFLARFEFSALKLPVIANVTARPYPDDAIRENLTNQLASTVRWSESVRYLMALGVARGAAMRFEEVGHGDVLSRLLQTIQKQTPHSVLHSIALENGLMSEAAASGKLATATEKVMLWNREHPIGTRVRSLIAEHADLETRTAAVVLFGHRAAVYVKGYNGYFDLDEIAPV
jgi:malonyl CoA-acyl carrier protein transacylase